MKDLLSIELYKIKLFSLKPAMILISLIVCITSFFSISIIGGKIAAMMFASVVLVLLSKHINEIESNHSRTLITLGYSRLNIVIAKFIGDWINIAPVSLFISIVVVVNYKILRIGISSFTFNFINIMNIFFSIVLLFFILIISTLLITFFSISAKSLSNYNSIWLIHFTYSLSSYNNMYKNFDEFKISPLQLFPLYYIDLILIDSITIGQIIFLILLLLSYVFLAIFFNHELIIYRDIE